MRRGPADDSNLTGASGIGFLCVPNRPPDNGPKGGSDVIRPLMSAGEQRQDRARAPLRAKTLIAHSADMARPQQYIMVGAILVVFIRLWTLQPPPYPSADLDGNPHLDTFHSNEKPHHHATNSKQTVPGYEPGNQSPATSKPWPGKKSGHQSTEGAPAIREEMLQQSDALQLIDSGGSGLLQPPVSTPPLSTKRAIPFRQQADETQRGGSGAVGVGESLQTGKGRHGALAAGTARRRPARRPPPLVSSHARHLSPPQQSSSHRSRQQGAAHGHSQITHQKGADSLGEEHREVVEPAEAIEEETEDSKVSPREEAVGDDPSVQEDGEEDEEEEVDGESLEGAMAAAQEDSSGGSTGGGGHPHSDPTAWLSGRLDWLHLLKKPGTSVSPVIMAQDNVFDGRTKYKMWINSQTKTLSLDDRFLGHHLPIHDYGAKATRQHRTCALVGNSGILLGKGLGKKIDGHEAVLRINYPPVKRYEEDVGYKTTYDFSNRENARRILNQRRFPGRKPATLVFFEISSHTNREKLFGPLMEKYPEFKIHYLHPDFVFRAMRLWNEIQKEVEAQQHKKFKPKPMSGWLAIMFMSQMCETLDVYGFEGYNNPHASHPYHYFDKVKAVLKAHSFDFAMEAYRMLGELYNLRVHT